MGKKQSSKKKLKALEIRDAVVVPNKMESTMRKKHSSKKSSKALIVDEIGDEVVIPNKKRLAGVNVSIDPACCEAAGNVIHGFAEYKATRIKAMGEASKITESDRSFMMNIINSERLYFEEKEALLAQDYLYKLGSAVLTCGAFLLSVCLTEHGKNSRSIRYNLFHRR